MKVLKAELANFSPVFHDFCMKEARSERKGILRQKDPPRKELSLDTIESFSYDDQLEKFTSTNPLLGTTPKGHLD